jgi:beta-galactosidase
VIAPNLYLVNDSAAKNIQRYVEDGGTLLMSFFSGIVDENEHIRLGGYPAPFLDLLGLVVEEYAPYPEAQANAIRTRDGKEFRCTFWSDVIHLKNAASLATFEQDYYAGGPAITHNTFGQGNAFYVGTLPDPNGMEWLIDYVCKSADIQPIAVNAPVGVELLQRVGETSAFVFALNHSNERVKVTFEGEGCNLLTQTDVNGSVELEPSDVAVIQMK